MEKSRFFNSSGGDRKYLAEDFAEYFASIVSNGVFLHEANALKVTPYSGRTISIAAGKAHINGYAYQNTTSLNKTLATVTSNRIDRIVVRLDMTTRNILIAVKQGTPATSPVAPTLTRTADVHELGIADIYLASGTVSITAAMITDLRENPTYCGGVTMTVDRDEILGDISNTSTAFTEAATRANIMTNEKTPTIFGKVKKWFTDLKALAFKDQIVDSDIASNAAINTSKISGFGAAVASIIAGGGYEKKTVLYSGGASLNSIGNSLPLSIAMPNGELIEMHYTIDNNRGGQGYVRRFRLTSNFSIAEIVGGATYADDGFVFINYRINYNGDAFTLTSKYGTYSNGNGEGVLPSVGGISISYVYRITN